jgi:hypothetical protein
LNNRSNHILICRHHEQVDRSEISISQMAMNRFPSTDIFFSLSLIRRIPNLAIPVIRQEFYTKQELLNLREHLDSSQLLLTWPVFLIFLFVLFVNVFLYFGLLPVLMDCYLCWWTVTCVDGLLPVLVDCYLCWWTVTCVDGLLPVLMDCYLCWWTVTCVDRLFPRFSLTLMYVRKVTLHIIQLFNVIYNSVELNIFFSKLMNPRRANNQTQWLQWLLAYIHIITY